MYDTHRIHGCRWGQAHFKPAEHSKILQAAGLADGAGVGSLRGEATLATLNEVAWDRHAT